MKQSVSGKQKRQETNNPNNDLFKVNQQPMCPSHANEVTPMVYADETGQIVM